MIYGQKGAKYRNVLLLRKSLISSDLAILSTESPEKDPRLISAPHDNKSRASSILSFSTASCRGLKWSNNNGIIMLLLENCLVILESIWLYQMNYLNINIKFGKKLSKLSPFNKNSKIYKDLKITSFFLDTGTWGWECTIHDTVLSLRNAPGAKTWGPGDSWHSELSTLVSDWKSGHF